MSSPLNLASKALYDLAPPCLITYHPMLPCSGLQLYDAMNESLWQQLSPKIHSFVPTSCIHDHSNRVRKSRSLNDHKKGYLSNHLIE